MTKEDWNECSGSIVATIFIVLAAIIAYFF
jgi:hypothetical protein